MAKGSVYDQARYLGKKTRMSAEDQTKSEGGSGRIHPAAAARRKPAASSLAPREGGKRKHYGRPFNEGK